MVVNRGGHAREIRSEEQARLGYAVRELAWTRFTDWRRVVLERYRRRNEPQPTDDVLRREASEQGFAVLGRSPTAYPRSWETITDLVDLCIDNPGHRQQVLSCLTLLWTQALDAQPSVTGHRGTRARD